MGGLNSGRSRSKTYLGQLMHIKLNDVKEYFGKVQVGAMASGTMTWSNGNQIGVRYNPEGMCLSFSSNGQSYSQQVNVAYTPCNYGGQGRPWLLCGCGGRTNKLYLAGGMRFVCRKCSGKKYQSQSLSPLDRGTWTIRKHQKKLDPKGAHEIWDFPAKPKGMHSSTYERVRDDLTQAMLQREEVADVHLASVLRRFGGMEGLLDPVEPPKKSRKPGFWG